MDNNKKFDTIFDIILLIVTIFCVVLSILQNQEIKSLKTDITTLQTENEVLNQTIETLKAEANVNEFDLNNCPLCDNEVRLKTVNDSYYIECETYNGNKGCGLKTNFYDSKAELVNYWNNPERILNYEK